VPRISAVYGIVIGMYYGNHPPLLFHARYGGDSAKIEIEGGEVIAGSLPGRGLRLVREWFEEHCGELEANWERAVHHQRPHPIDRSASMKEIIHVTDVVPLEGWKGTGFA
jgi:hypothetical protein